MTIGIGGWGPRRKPMALVRAILRSDLKDLTIVSAGAAPTSACCCRAGKVRKLVYAFVSLDSVPLEPHFQRARQDGTIPEVVELDEGMFQTGLRAAAQRLPFLPMRAGLGSDVLVNNPGIRTVTSPYDDGEELVAVPALELDVALVHLNRADQHGNATYLGPDPYFDDLFCMAADRAYVSVRADRRHRRADRRRPGPAAAAQPDDGRRRGRDARTARTSPPARPTTSATRSSRRRTPPRPAAPTRTWAAFERAVPRRRRGGLPGRRRGVRARRQRMSDVDPRRVCAAAIADAFARRRRDLRQPDGPAADARRPAGQLTSNPDLVISDGESLFLGRRAAAVRARPTSSRAGSRSAGSSTSSPTASGT